MTRPFIRNALVLDLIVLLLVSVVAACGNPRASTAAVVGPTPPAATGQPAPPSPTPTASPPVAVPAGDPSLPAAAYPARVVAGAILTGDAAMNRIARPDTAERELFDATLARMGSGAPTAERILALNTSDPNNPSWTYLPGDEQKLYVAVVREGGTEKVDPSLHDWRVGNVSGVELVRWQEVTPPPGADNLRLIANGTTTVIGAFQGDTLVYWFSTEAENGQGNWFPNDSNMPDGASEYKFDNEKYTWVTRVGDTVFEYRSGNWNEVIDLGTVRDEQWWDGAGWQALPEGEGWQVSVAEDGTVKAVDANGAEYIWDGQWMEVAPTATPAPESQLAPGEVVFEKTLGAEVIRAAVPEQVVSILAAAGTEPGQYEEVEKAVWKVEENAIMLGKIPVFVKDGGEWRYNEQVLYEENYINLGPALVLPNVSSFSNPELEEWPPAGVFVQNHSGFDTIATAGQLAGGEISEVVLLHRGSTMETQQAYLEFKYKNPETNQVTSFSTTQHHAIAVNGSKRSFSSLSGKDNAVVIVTKSSRKPYSEFASKLVGTELGSIDIAIVKSVILQGGVLPSTDSFIETSLADY